MSPKMFLSGVALLTTIVLSPLTFAQDSLERAVSLANEASTLFEAGDFVGAAAKFGEAYSLYNEPTLLKNQVVALYKANLCTEALKLSRDYEINGANQPAADREDVRVIRIDCLHRSAEAAYRANELDLANEHILTARTIGLINDDERARFRSIEELIEKRRGPQQDPSVEQGSTSVLPIVGWSVTGLGLATVAVSGILHVTYFLDYKEKDDLFRDKVAKDSITPDERIEWNDAYDDAADKIGGLVPFYAIGGALTAVGGGILIYHYFLSDDDATALQVSPTIDPTGAGLQLHMRF